MHTRGFYAPALAFLALAAGFARAQEIPKAHPRLFGPLAQLQALKAARPDAYKTMAANARDPKVFDWGRLPAMALTSALENDAALGKEAVKLCMKYIRGPIRVGHETFGHDLALCAMVYDYCHACWTEDERKEFVAYMNKTVDANVQSEIYVFANGYYGYKNWGIGLACYATYYENPKAPEYLRALHDDLRARAMPALDTAGDGGTWAEGHYTHYFLYEWLVFCEVARACEGIDYYKLAPKFFNHRAIASMFEMMPGDTPSTSNNGIPMGDGGYGDYGGASEKILAARRILANYFRSDPAHQAVHAYNQLVPDQMIPEGYGYMGFLWNDKSIPKGDLKSFKLSHFAPGAGTVYARSSWEGDATYLYFRCGDRYTGHQHLDVGHFMIARHGLLVGDAGVYDSFQSNHGSNFYLRSIAHNTLLVFDPAEKFPDGIRAWSTTANDGGQAYPWIGTPCGHNGNMLDVEFLNKHKPLSDIADILAYEDKGTYVYTAGDCTRAYAAKKLDFFTRQIVYLRPGTVVVFDRVQSKDPSFKKTFLLQAMKTPTGSAPNLTICNGPSKLFVQTLLPANADVTLHAGADLYRYGGQDFAPIAKPSGTVPECRIEVSPKSPALFDCFLHVLTAADASAGEAPKATCKSDGGSVSVTVGGATIRFQTGSVAASIDLGGGKTELANRIMADPTAGRAANTAAANTAAASPSAPLKIPAAAKAEEGPSDDQKKAGEAQYAALKKKILDALNGGRREFVYVNVFGQQNRVKLVAGDEKALKVEVQGNKVEVAWKDVTPRQFYGIASMYAGDSDALYAYCIGAGLREEAEQTLLRK
ncbi:MAG: heparinase II/III family protein [Planctomycetota bacterium]|nr:heparinase II/III family protein [Planctomycetota bacterium]